jgi:hypothetical protein
MCICHSLVLSFLQAILTMQSYQAQLIYSCIVALLHLAQLKRETYQLIQKWEYLLFTV